MAVARAMRGALLVALQVETEALTLQITRLTAFQDRVRGLVDEASAACALFDTLDADAASTKYADLLKPYALPSGHALCAMPYGHHAIVECEERAVAFDGMLEQLIQIFCTEKNPMCPAGSAQSACPAGSAQSAQLILASQELRRKPLLLATATLTQLANLWPIAHAIASCPADLHTCLEKALEKKDMLGLALLLADGRVDLEKHGLRITIAAAQTGHTDIICAVLKKGLPHTTATAAEILLLEDKELRQAAFETHICTNRYTYGTELAEQIERILALLASMLVGPGAYSDELLRVFVRSRNASAVRALLADPRFDPSDNKILGSLEMARNIGSSAELKHLLVNYAGTRPDMPKTKVLFAATICKDLVNIQALLADPSINLTEERLFDQAILTGSVDVVSLFLLNKRVNPAAHGNYALTLARRINNRALEALLLTNERVRDSLHDLN